MLISELLQVMSLYAFCALVGLSRHGLGVSGPLQEARGPWIWNPSLIRHDETGTRNGLAGTLTCRSHHGLGGVAGPLKETQEPWILSLCSIKHDETGMEHGFANWTC